MAVRKELPSLTDHLERLAGALEALSMGADSSSLAQERDRLVRTIRTYLIPRAVDPSTPLTVVFAGPTGAGKSTMINSLTGLDLSEAGAIRPTTTGPVVMTSRDRSSEYSTIAGVASDVVVGEAPILDSMVLVDTPDIDSTSTEHRAIAEMLIDNADVVVFVTSALRYADFVPWQVLRRAESRGTDVVHVLNRVAARTRGAVVDFQARLRTAGLEDEVVTVPEHHLPPRSQRVPSVAVRGLRRRLAALAGDHEETADRVFDRVLDTLVQQVGSLGDEISVAADEIDLFDAELGEELAERVSGLELAAVARDLYEPGPSGESGGAGRRWMRSSRRDPLDADEVDRLVTGIEIVVSSDLRRWLADRGDTLPVHVEPGHLLRLNMPVLRIALEGWIDFARRITKDEGRRRAGLAEAVLVEAATRDDESPAARLLFGEQAPAVVERARRELTGRLEVVYEQVGAQVVDLAHARAGEPDLTDLRAALGAVGSTHAPIHA